MLRGIEKTAESRLFLCAAALPSRAALRMALRGISSFAAPWTSARVSTYPWWTRSDGPSSSSAGCSRLVARKASHTTLTMSPVNSAAGFSPWCSGTLNCYMSPDAIPGSRVLQPVFVEFMAQESPEQVCGVVKRRGEHSGAGPYCQPLLPFVGALSSRTCSPSYRQGELMLQCRT